jgi:hypothetical protein
MHTHHDTVDGLLQAPNPDHLNRCGRGGVVGQGASVFLGEVDLDDLDLGSEATEGGRCGRGGRQEVARRREGVRPRGHGLLESLVKQARARSFYKSTVVGGEGR